MAATVRAECTDTTAHVRANSIHIRDFASIGELSGAIVPPCGSEARVTTENLCYYLYVAHYLKFILARVPGALFAISPTAGTDATASRRVTLALQRATIGNA